MMDSEVQTWSLGIAALANKLVPCVWLTNGALEVWRLRLSLHHLKGRQQKVGRVEQVS